MPDHCDKGPILERLLSDSERSHEKLDQIATALTALAVQKERVDALGKKSEDHEQRIRKIEDQPRKLIVWCGGITSSVAAAWVIYRLGFGG
jgi:hypothetical protein